MRLNHLFAAIALVTLGIIARLLPHPPNVAPIAAIALVAGAFFPRLWAFLVPVAAMVASDATIGFHPVVLFTWGSFALTASLGRAMLHRSRSPLRLLSASVAGSVLFFLLTNGAVWALTPLYDKTTGGLAAAYVAGIPFFRNTVAGDLGWTVGLFALIAALRRFALPFARRALAFARARRVES